MAIDTHSKKLEFLHKIAKLGMEHLDGGGVVGGGGAGGVLSNVSGALTTQNTYNAAAPTSIGTIGNQQAGLAKELTTESAGGGPNPAQLQLMQNAQQNAQTQAVTNANNRAINPGLAARLSGNEAASTAQAATAAAGTQQAEQQIAAQQQLEGLTGQEQTGALSAEQINAATAQANANATNQTEGGFLSGAGSAVSSLLAEGGEVKKMADGGPLTVPSVNASAPLPAYVAPTPVSSKGNPGLSALGSAGGSYLKNAMKSSTPATSGADTTPGATANAGNDFATSANNYGVGDSAGATADYGAVAPSATFGSSLADAGPIALALAKGGQMPVHLEHMAKLYHGHRMAPTSLMKTGGPVKAQTKDEKAKVKGDSYSNDKIPALLSQGELVIDRDTMADPGPAGQMARALKKHLESKNGKKKK